MKKTILLLSVFAIGVVLYGCKSFDYSSSQTRTYNIGDTGPAGGIVFYDKGDYKNGWCYMEAAPAEAEFSAVWGPYGTNIRNTNTSVSSGKQNTQLIFEGQGQTISYAALLCYRLDINGYKDWFLPSKDELSLMYQNLHQKGLGGFGNAWYWSSSQINDGSAWSQHFGDGGRSYHDKGYEGIIRAVRAF